MFTAKPFRLTKLDYYGYRNAGSGLVARVDAVAVKHSANSLVFDRGGKLRYYLNADGNCFVEHVGNGDTQAIFAPVKFIPRGDDFLEDAKLVEIYAALVEAEKEMMRDETARAIAAEEEALRFECGRKYIALVRFMGKHLRDWGTAFGCPYDHNLGFNALLTRELPAAMSDITSEATSSLVNDRDRVDDFIALMIVVASCSLSITAQSEFAHTLQRDCPELVADFKYFRTLIDFMQECGFEWQHPHFGTSEPYIAMLGPRVLNSRTMGIIAEIAANQWLCDKVVKAAQLVVRVARSPELNRSRVKELPDYVPQQPDPDEGALIQAASVGAN